MQNIFKEKIHGGDIKDGTVLLINVPAKKIIETNAEILKWYISEKNYTVVYVTVNKPFAELIENFKKMKIDTNKIFFIDAITPRKFINGDSRAENAVFLGSPKELTNISITTTSTLEKLSAAKVLIFDSISTLMVYNEFNIVKDFIHFITNKMKSLKVTFAMISVKEAMDKKAIDELRVFADEVIDID